MEATGTYGEALATYLHQSCHLVSIVNPAAIKAYGQSYLSRTKTDKADSTLIAQFCSERHPPQWQPLPTEIREWQALVRRLDSLPGSSRDDQSGGISCRFVLLASEHSSNLLGQGN
jgi:transposase